MQILILYFFLLQHNNNVIVSAHSSFITYLRDVFFQATMFLEFWKRRQAEIAYEWDLLGYEDEEVSRGLHEVQ